MRPVVAIVATEHKNGRKQGDTTHERIVAGGASPEWDLCKGIGASDVREVPMQTCRHWIFSALALSAIACAARTPVGAVAVCPPATGEIEAEPTAESEAEPEPAPASVQPRPPVEGAPVIRLVQMPSPDTVLLHFSEPVAVEPGFDPKQFRLSLATLERDEEGYTELYYYDPQGVDDPLVATRVAAIVAHDEHTLRLLLAPPLDAELCEEFNELAVESAEDPNVQGGLYLHYRDDGRTGIADREGVRLAEIAESWVEREPLATSHMGVNMPPIEAWGPIGCSSGSRRDRLPI